MTDSPDPMGAPSKLRLGGVFRQAPETHPYNQPLVLAIRAASTRFAAPSLLIASDK